MSKHLRHAVACTVVWIAMSIAAPGAWAIAGPETYMYDPLGRLTSVTYPDGKAVTYAYDSAGNRTSYFSLAAAPTTDTPVMTEGNHVGSGPMFWNGYFPAFSTGALNPTTLTGGRTVTNFWEQWINGAYWQTVFSVSGFATDPGKAWLISVNAHGQTRYGATAPSYAYSAGLATWTWSAPAGNTTMGFTGSGTTPCTIVHQ